jgi:hypothetical protein
MWLRTNVFYVLLLEPVPKNIEAEGEEEEWDVKKILDLYITKG